MLFGSVDWPVALAPLQRMVDPLADRTVPHLIAMMEKFDDVASWLEDSYRVPLSSSLPVKFIAWQPGDVVGCVVLLAAFTIIRFTIERFVFHPISRRVCVPAKFQKPGESVPAKYRDQMEKFVESCWKCFIYAVFVVLAVVVVYNEDFVHRSRALWEGCFNFPCEVKRSPKIRSLYLIEMTYYIFGMFCLFLWEARRKDHYVMLAHHIVTLILIGGSYWYNFMRVGSIIMLLHDVCDVPMELAKIFRYSNPDTKSHALNAASEVTFTTFFIVWILARLVYFPLYVLNSVIFDSCYVIRGYVRATNCWPYQHLVAGFLLALFFMHVYWTRLIAIIIMRFLMHGEREDVRED